ncbi:hypothetical protein AVEN_117677-1, partial [Araneus ventricosus]
IPVHSGGTIFDTAASFINGII